MVLKYQLVKQRQYGSSCYSDERLCPDLDIKGVKNFELLGVQFDNNLNNMDLNFQTKILSIQKLLSHWSYRHLTPFGKLTVIRSLALSKLSHLAMIIPNPSKQMFKDIDKILFNFLWGNKSEKVRRDDCKLPEKLGGLGMPDVEQYWLSFKFSWVRRLLTSKSYWPDIFMDRFSSCYGKNITIGEMLELGPDLLGKIGKLLRNKFWGQVLLSLPRVSENFAFCEPESLLDSSFWYNSNIKRGNKVVKYSDFPEIENKVTVLGDFFEPGTNVFMDLNRFNQRYSTNLPYLKFIDIRYIVSLTFQKLKFCSSKLIPASYPILPTLIKIALRSTKGCSAYYKILNKKRCLQSKIVLRDQKWHLELQSYYDISFWNKVRLLTSKLSLNNNLKWLQFRINRNSLQTKYITSHFIAGISPLCEYCGGEEEKISHLFWLCPVVKQFLINVFQYVENLGMTVNPSMKDFLFGDVRVSFEHPRNYLPLLIKHYIWKTKFLNAVLNLKGFSNFLKDCLNELKIMYEIKNKNSLFNEWVLLYSNLCQDNHQHVYRTTI